MSAWTRERISHLRKLAARGCCTGQEIADVLETNRGVVHRILRRLGLHLRQSNRGRRAGGIDRGLGP